MAALLKRHHTAVHDVSFAVEEGESDHPVVRDGLRSVIDGEVDMQVVGETGDGAEAVVRIGAEAEVDAVLMDLRMPTMGDHRCVAPGGAVGAGARAHHVRRRP